MQILECKKTPDTEGLSLDATIGASPSSLKALPPLAVLSILDSSFLRQIYRCFYCLFVVAFVIALAPYSTDSRSTFIQHIGWIGLLLTGCMVLWLIYKWQCSVIPVGSLAYENGYWVLCDRGVNANYLVAGEVLCWPWLIILPLRDVTTGCKRHLLLSADALQPADQARLRTWLRACLKPKG